MPSLDKAGSASQSPPALQRDHVLDLGFFSAVAVRCSHNLLSGQVGSDPARRAPAASGSVRTCTSRAGLSPRANNHFSTVAVVIQPPDCLRHALALALLPVQPPIAHAGLEAARGGLANRESDGERACGGHQEKIRVFLRVFRESRRFGSHHAANARARTAGGIRLRASVTCGMQLAPGHHQQAGAGRTRLRSSRQRGGSFTTRLSQNVRLPLRSP